MREGKFRLYNKDVIHKLDLLLSTGDYHLKNDLYQEVFRRGVEDLYNRAFERKIEDKGLKEVDMAKQMNFVKLSVDELFLAVSMIKHLVATMYNINLALLEGEKVDKTLIETGALSILPKELQEIETSMYEKYRKERNK